MTEPLQGSPGQPWGEGCVGVGAQRRELPPARADPCLLSCPAVYAVHNLSEVSLTQYELDSK